MKIILVRHTKVAVAAGTIYGQSNVALANSATSDIARVQEEISGACAAIYSSPLMRCQHLANSLAERFGTPPILDKRLMEMNFGDWENKSWQQIPTQQARHWGNHWLTEPAPAGESFQDVLRRISLFCQECLHYGPQESVIVVSHSGPLRCLCLQIHPEFKSWPHHNAFKIPLDYGAVMQFEYTR